MQLAVLLAVLGIAAGLLFGRADPERAARLVVAEFTVIEDGDGQTPGPDPIAPTTGPQRGEPSCGLLQRPLPAEQQVATLSAGVVLIQHDPQLDDAQQARLEALADARARVAVAPQPALEEGEVVVATSWRHRMPLDRVDLELLTAFVTGHADRAPVVTPCAPGAVQNDGTVRRR